MLGTTSDTRKRKGDDQYHREKSSSIISGFLDLPIFAFKNILQETVQKFITTIVVGETGSGKSTQLPQYLSEIFPSECIVCTQPRRVAAVSVALRVAHECSCTIGHKVGYSIRFDEKSSHHTKIKFVTDGILLQEVRSDPNLQRYKVIILDEAHERSLQTDMLMGLIKLIQHRRSDLRLVIMSATLDVDLFKQYFNVISCLPSYIGIT